MAPDQKGDAGSLSPKLGYATIFFKDEAALGYFQVGVYSVGHVLNDMAAAVWFSYLLLYLQEAEGLSATQAGGVMFAGQLADALATPLVGLASDASQGCLGLGRRKAWNAVGVAIVALNFTLMFGGVLPAGAGGLSAPAKAAALGVFAALFNVGWAAVQVSHMALVPELTRSEGMRVVLNSARYAFTVLSNCAVFLVVLGLVGLQAGPTADGDPRYKDPALYRTLSHVVLGVGGAASAAFLCLCREPTAEELAAGGGSAGAVHGSPGARESSRTDLLLSAAEAHVAEADERAAAAPLLSRGSASKRRAGEARGGGGDSVGEGAAAPPLRRPRRGSGETASFYAVATWRDWLVVPDFWRIMAVYTLVRLSVNISQVYLTFFVTEVLQMDQTAVAITPLLLYVAQLVSTAASRRVAVRLGRRRSIVLGSALTVLACVAMGFVQRGGSSVLIYPAVLLLGVGLALSMVISVSMEADLVGSRTASAAFVYGACSFSDKLSSGVFVLGIQTMRDMVFSEGSPGHNLFIRLVNASVPAASAVLAALISTNIAFPRDPGATTALISSLQGDGGDATHTGARPPSRGLVAAPALEVLELSGEGASYVPPAGR